MKGKLIFMGLLASALTFAADSRDRNYNDRMNNQQKDEMMYAEKYTGFDINVGVGYWGAKVEKIHEDPLRGSAKSDRGANGVSVQGRVGYTYGFCDRWIVGLDAYAQYNNSSADGTISSGLYDLSLDEKVEMNADYGLDVRFGVVAAPSNMYYLTIGPDWVDMKTDQSTTFDGFRYHDSTSDYKIGVRFGAGAEQMFSENWVIKEQFSYTWFDTLSFTHKDGSKLSYKARMATMLFMLGYLF